MFDNNLVFSFILSLANTFMYYLFNTPKYESQMSNRNQELLMVFGITFAMSFFMRSVSSKGGDSINYSSNIPPGEVLLSQSTRPPF